jgi:hypothetical protein
MNSFTQRSTLSLVSPAIAGRSRRPDSRACPTAARRPRPPQPARWLGASRSGRTTLRCLLGCTDATRLLGQEQRLHPIDDGLLGDHAAFDVRAARQATTAAASTAQPLSIVRSRVSAIPRLRPDGAQRPDEGTAAHPSVQLTHLRNVFRDGLAPCRAPADRGWKGPLQPTDMDKVSAVWFGLAIQRSCR